MSNDGDTLFVDLDGGAPPRPAHAQAISQSVVCGLLRGFEAAWVFFSALLTLALYVHMNPGYASEPRIFVLIGLVAAFSADATFTALHLYKFAQFANPRRALGRLAAGWLGVILGGLALAFLTKTSADLSRIWLVSWALTAFGGVAAARLVLAALVARWSAAGRLARHIAILGGGPEASRMIGELRACAADDVRILGVFDDRSTRLAPELGGVGFRGDVDALISLARTRVIDEIIMALPSSAVDRITHFVQRLRVLPVDLRLWIDVPISKIAINSIDCGSGIPVAALRDRPLRHWSALSKRIEDVVIAAPLLLLLAPVMAMAAIAVKLDSRGPVLFRQKRFGFNNNVIEVLKFRTMFVERSDASGVAQTRPNDPRVTRVGRWLRRASLDELPQLANVLAGSMSMVGPRPHPLAMRAADRLYHEAVGEYFARHRVKPGITGLAQVSGCRGETDTIEKARQRIALDLAYIDEWSILTDLKIIVRTFAHLVEPNAY
jgi:Undecaprenyl-phosphate glucose phosphotransferase